MCDTIYFEKINDKDIFTIFSDTHSNSKNLVIMSHGFKGNSVGAARSFVNFSRFLVEKGISVVRFDQPCSGNSQGNFIDSSFKEWVDTIVHFTKKYHDEGYKIALLGHSMGADASIVAASNEELIGKVSALLLWAPDPKSNPDEWFVKDARLADRQNQVYEENGQLFRSSYWQEVLDADIFKCLQQYTGKIHLVYGENDKFVSEAQREKVMSEVRNKNQDIMILKGQDHMMWDFDVCSNVFEAEYNILKEVFSL